jgi:hypothetical protein
MSEKFHQRNCGSCDGNNDHYEPTWCFPAYCIIQQKHINHTDYHKIRKEGCEPWKERSVKNDFR